MEILQISYVSTSEETSEEDKFWYDESEKVLEFSDADFGKHVFNKNK